MKTPDPIREAEKKLDRSENKMLRVTFWLLLGVATAYGLIALIDLWTSWKIHHP